MQQDAGIDPETQPLVVACDESGNDGENLLTGGSPVFVHASTILDRAMAADIMAEVRARTRSRRVELKSSTLLQPKNETTARWLLELPELESRVSLHFTDKRHFLVTKLFDATIEERAHSLGLDLYADGAALCGANILSITGPGVYGEQWEALLVAFQGFLRSKSVPEGSESLAALDSRLVAMLRSGKGAPRDFFLFQIHAGIEHLRHLSPLQLGEGIDHRLRTLDPLIPAVGAAVAYWSGQSGRSIEMLHDSAKELTPAQVAAIRNALASPEIVAPHRAGREVDLTGVTLVDSKVEERVQVADLLAGLGRRVFEKERAGGTHPLTAAVEPYMSKLSIVPNPALMDPEVARAVARAL